MSKRPENTSRNFLELSDIQTNEINSMLGISKKLKKHKDNSSRWSGPLNNKILAMIFEQPSTRTRISFDVGMRELGGQTIMLTGSEMQLGRGETIADTARVLSRYVDAILIRTLEYGSLKEMAEFATVPVINGLTKDSHPCQLMADVLTFEEHKGSITGKTVTWMGDCNNVLNSWIHAAEKLNFEIRIATPPELQPNFEIISKARVNGAKIELTSDPFEAVSESDCIVTDCWVSMGEVDTSARHNVLHPYQVNEKLMASAKSDAIFMHCLPAHRGEEVTDAVIDGPQSVVFDEAENRLHAQKGILAWCFNMKLEDL